jgi:hypothetical protein
VSSTTSANRRGGLGGTYRNRLKMKHLQNGNTRKAQSSVVGGCLGWRGIRKLVTDLAAGKADSRG